MLAHVRLETPNGDVHTLTHGDIIGRLGSVALPLDDSRVSEAHAMVSLRGGEFKLLALRGRFALDGGALSELTLAAGQRIRLTRTLALKVVSVVLPKIVMTVEGDALPRTVLTGSCSLILEPQPAIVKGTREGAAAVLWNRDEQWRVRVGEEPPRDLNPGDWWTAAGGRFEAGALSLSGVGLQQTRQDGRLEGALLIIVEHDAVRLVQDGEVVLAFGGNPAKAICELVAFDCSADWAVLAAEVWPRAPDRHALRKRLDIMLLRLRKRLAAAGLRTDLVQTDGSGHIALNLTAGDRIEDRS